MRGSKSTYLLLAAFLAALVTLWGLERAGVRTEAERLRRRDRVFPDLIDLEQTDVKRVEIARDGETLVFDRRGRGRWTLADPPGVDAAAEEVERLIATVRGLRASPEAGEVDGPASSFGLAPPEATIRLWNDPAASPLATLEVGRATGRERFVRPGPDGPVAVVTARTLSALERPAVAWRETAPVPSRVFPITGVAIRRDGLDATVDRTRRGTWRLTAPVEFPADDRRVERLLEALAALRVDPETGGFAADRVADFAPYGLDPPSATIALKPAAAGAEPLVLAVGASPKDRPDDVFVRLEGRDDVMIVPGRFRRDLPEALNDLRDRHVADVDPATVGRIEIDAPSGSFRLERDREGWSLSAPVAARADRARVDALLKAVEDLQASEFHAPDAVGDPGLDPPRYRLRLWTAKADSGPAFALAIGRHDALLKTVFARVAGDSAVLALPDRFLPALPTTALAFRDAALPTVQPASVSRLTIARPGRTTVLEPADPSGAPNRWRMTRPVAADADPAAVAAALARLSELRASRFVADVDADADLARFGLDEPILEVRWESSIPPNGAHASSRRLRVGAATPEDPSRHYGVLSNVPAVFTIDAESLAPFGAEFHATRVLSFRAESVRRLKLRSETKTLAYRRRPRPGGGPAGWAPEAGAPSRGMDLSRFDSLVEALADLRAIRFIQYEGPLPPGAGLESPRLTVDVEVEGRDEPVRLRVGSNFLRSWVCAATGDAPAGPAFLLQAPAWEALIREVEGGLPPIPDDPFAPPPPNPANG